MMEPYFRNDMVELYVGDCRELLPQLSAADVRADVCVTDPPYGETSHGWDRWQHGWIAAVAAALPATSTLWSFGNTRVMLNHGPEFAAAGWKFYQDALWVKHNGSGPTSRDRLNRVHEWSYGFCRGAQQFYRGKWGELRHDWPRVPHTGPLKGTARKGTNQAPHHGARRDNVWSDDGMRQPRSVVLADDFGDELRLMQARSVRYQRRHPDEKPIETVVPLVNECAAAGQTVLDPFAGAGTTAVAAAALGVRSVLIESREEQCEIIAKRLSGRAEVEALTAALTEANYLEAS